MTYLCVYESSRPVNNWLEVNKMTTRISILFVFLTLLTNNGFYNHNLALAVSINEKNDWLIVPGKRVGPITSETSQADLISLFGKENVTTKKDFYTYEEDRNGVITMLFPGNNKYSVIFWNDEVNIRKPKLIQIISNGVNQKNSWKTKEGISIGTCLKELENINKGPFSFYGFGWDAGGFVTSWGNGLLESEFKDKIKIQLLDTSHQILSENEFHLTRGEQTQRSDDEVVRKLNPCVNEIHIRF